MKELWSCRCTHGEIGQWERRAEDGPGKPAPRCPSCGEEALFDRFLIEPDDCNNWPEGERERAVASVVLDEWGNAGVIRDPTNLRWDDFAAQIVAALDR